MLKISLPLIRARLIIEIVAVFIWNSYFILTQAVASITTFNVRDYLIQGKNLMLIFSVAIDVDLYIFSIGRLWLGVNVF